MRNLTDHIEAYLKRLLQEAGVDAVEIRRAQLADQFACVPSQINYVLETRFTPERGYLVESRRGGGGYIRILRLRFERKSRFLERLEEEFGREVSEREATSLLDRLAEIGVVEEELVALAKALVRREASRWEPGARGKVRAALLRVVLPLLLRED